MKLTVKIILISFLTLFFGHGNLIAGKTSGCGIGTLLWEGARGATANISAITTNKTFTNDFSITTGTSGCDGSDSKSVKNFL